ncbi:very short patch repair endonuclease [Pedobacter frigidisoli]|uniref:Very short patch repair endonuclease n=1 Tax=Pedobacter frigidisoli TaxID=2530455 RepID=A0A4R0P183_9SPHI|nr:very short patch repair endonuclease [Pedobacter frigidisoli]TCD10496.1 very short patch repair endonuclease [Pedobacter frigidisoli]
MDSKPYTSVDVEIKVPRFEESAGFYTTVQRSRTMSKIKGKNSIPELKLRKALWAKNVRFRIHPKGFQGKPDLIINKYRLAIFVDGDFWHGYEWEERKSSLKKNTGFWIPKIERNMQRDRQINEVLSAKGYTVMRFWEHQVKENLAKCVNQVLLYIEAVRMGVLPSTI